MTWTLGIDTSTTELGLALYCEGRPACAVSRYLPNSHAEHIAGCIEFLLKSTGATPESITAAGIATGPGSFTGLRIGLSFIKGFCFGRPIPVLPISSLESTARAWNGNGTVAVIFEARRDEAFCARFSLDDNGGITRLTPDTLLHATSLPAAIDTCDTVLMDRLGYERSTLGAALASTGRFRIDVQTLPLQRGIACARAAAQCPPDSPAWSTALDVLPAYMRLSAPEEKLL